MKKLGLVLAALAALVAGSANATVGTYTANVAVPVQIVLTPLCQLTAPSTIVVNYTSFGASTNASQSGSVQCTNSRGYKLSWSATDDSVTSSGTLTASTIGITYALDITTGATGTGAGTTAQTFTVKATTTGNEAGTCAGTGATCSATNPTTLYVHY